ncbi:MAG: hypothetical protein AB1405_03600 [Bdellovibrionota bacterium]
MQSQYEKATLANIGGGGLPEKFEAELQKVLANIADINTDPEEKRRIVIKVTFEPSETRQEGNVRVSCESKLAPIVSSSGSVVFEKSGARFEAHARVATQAPLFDPASKVVPINGETKS